MGWKVFLDWPDGSWQKGSTTTLLMETCLSHARLNKRTRANVSKQLHVFIFSKEWLEVFLADDVVHAWSQQDPRVPFIAVAV